MPRHGSSMFNGLHENYWRIICLRHLEFFLIFALLVSRVINELFRGVLAFGGKTLKGQWTA